MANSTTLKQRNYDIQYHYTFTKQILKSKCWYIWVYTQLHLPPVVKRFTFPTMTNMKKISLITDIDSLRTFNEFFRSLVKSLKIKFLHSMTRFMRMLSIKMRDLKGLKNDIFDQQLWEFFQSTKQLPRGVL